MAIRTGQSSNKEEFLHVDHNFRGKLTNKSLFSYNGEKVSIYRNYYLYNIVDMFILLEKGNYLYNIADMFILLKKGNYLYNIADMFILLKIGNYYLYNIADMFILLKERKESMTQYTCKDGLLFVLHLRAGIFAKTNFYETC